LYTKKELFERYFKGLNIGDYIDVELEASRKGTPKKHFSGEIIFISKEFITIQGNKYKTTVSLADLATGKAKNIQRVYAS